MAVASVKYDSPFESAARFIGREDIIEDFIPGDYKVFTVAALCARDDLLIPESLRDALVDYIKDLYFYMFDPEHPRCPAPDEAEYYWEKFQTMEMLPG